MPPLDLPRTASALLAALPDGLLLIGPDHRIVYANAMAERLFGYPPGALLDAPLERLIPERYRAGHPERSRAFIEHHDTRSMGTRPVLHALAADGREFPVSIAISALDLDGIRYGIASIRDARNVNQHLDDARRRIETDALTGAGNRVALIRTASTRIAEHQPFALLFIDLNGFKPLNDQHGHRAGDRVLIEAVRRIESASRIGDLLARVGGDEFVLLLADLDDPNGLAQRAQRLADLIAHPIDFEGHRMTVTAAFGGALYPRNGTDIETLLARADAAMYDAKHGNRAFAIANDDLGRNSPSVEADVLTN